MSKIWATIMMVLGSFFTPTTTLINNFVPTPTPFAFNELTIPYLRSRAYDSQLAPLQQYSQNANYTSYLTSFISEGFKVDGLLTIPRTSGPHPAVIFIHGYISPDRYETTVNYASYVDYLARSGLVVFKIDLRGHGDSEGEATGAYYSSDYIIDVLNAYSALSKQDYVSSIGLWGHSMAGNVVARTLAAKPDINAAVIWAGAGYTYTDIQEFGIDDNSYQPPPPNTDRARRRQELRKLYGDFDPNSWFWKQVPATNYLSDFQGKIQIHHAIDDNVVSIEYSRNLKKLFPNFIELNEYLSGGHNLTGITFNSAMQRSSQFLKDNLH